MHLMQATCNHNPHNQSFTSWAAAMNLYNDQSYDSPDKPVMYSGSSGSSWGHGHMKLPHQMNFFEELRRALDEQPVTGPSVNTWN
ncbi:hypothetical protein OsJ_07398 [Oryza sativa Japonica Group]|uniref:Uncharacterized protein n=1 Tax=Oryza sativa subsp. japonica TaxID=39947 RepID=B9F0W9_ORYSJ|nr:hypothetical protein OsJ_07398 [Oryza sativa Japonica Group]